MSLSALLGVGACKKEDPAPKAETPPAAPVESKAEAPATPKDEPPVAAVAPGGRLNRGKGLGHFVLANPAHFLGEIKAQAAPEFAGLFLTEAVLRGYLGGSLGERTKVADNVRLDQPLGCAVIELPAPELPVACVVGYSGGAEALVADLGAEGKQQDPAGHAGYYKFEGNDLYIDALDDMVVVSNHAGIFADAKTYLKGIVVERAHTLDVDVEVVVFAAATFKQYKEQLTQFFEGLSAINEAGAATEGELAKSVSDYSTMANKEQMARLESSEQIILGLALDGQGLVARWSNHPVEGSPQMASNKELALGPVAAQTLARLPAAAWGVIAAKSAKMSQDSQLRKAGEALLVSFIVDQTKKERAAVEAEVKQLFEQAAAIYGNESFIALMDLPDTDGGFVAELVLKPEQSGREAWKAWSEKFTPASVLGPEAAKQVQWRFEHDAASYADVPIDRWTIEPTAEGKKALRKEAKDWEKRTDGYKLVVERAEVEGRAIFAIALRDAAPYTKAAIDALKGKATINDVPGFASVASLADEAGSVFAFDVQRGADWSRKIVPPDQAKQIPAGIGVDLGDIVGSNAWNEAGTASGQFRLSQPLLDEIRAQFDQQQ